MYNIGRKDQLTDPRHMHVLPKCCYGNTQVATRYVWHNNEAPDTRTKIACSAAINFQLITLLYTARLKSLNAN
jgi:hypothetical protein